MKSTQLLQIRLHFLLFCLLSFSSQVFSQKTWTGAISTDWSVADNWNPTGVPGPTDDISIPDVANDPVATGLQIFISAGQSMTIDAGAVLTINGQNSVDDGIRASGTVTNNGTIEISNVSDDGIEALNTFTNQSSGIIRINGCNKGILVGLGGVFHNNGRIEIGQTTPLVNFAVGTGVSSMGFNNNSCSLLEIFSNNPITDSENNFVNNGTIIERHNGTSNINTNNSRVFDLNGGNFDIANGPGASTNFPSTYIWSGSTDNDWFKLCNWESGLVPDFVPEVLIQDMVNDPVIGSPGAIARKINLQTGAVLTLLSGGTLTIDAQTTADRCLFNTGTCVIQAGATMTLDRSLADALVITGNGSFTNNGQLLIGHFGGNIGHAGILNNGANALFTNTGLLSVKQTGAQNLGLGKGIVNEGGTFTNNGGMVKIGQITSDALYNLNGGNVNNQAGSIEIGLSGAVPLNGILNVSTFINTATINVSNAGTDGIQNTSGGIFQNSGTISINNSAFSALANLQAASMFTNLSGGQVNIDTSGFLGITNDDATFTNFGIITISDTGTDGLQNRNDGNFQNNGGSMLVENTGTSNIAVLGSTSVFSNSNEGTITLLNANNNNIYVQGVLTNTTGGSITATAGNFTNLVLQVNGSFINGECSYFFGDSLIQIESGLTLTNMGYLQADTLVLQGNFNNSNGYVYFENFPFDCTLNGGTCLPGSLTYAQFTSDNDNDNIPFCEGDADDLDTYITFQVDMQNSLPVSPEGMFLYGNWLPNLVQMEDPDMNLVFTKTITLFNVPTGTPLEYKFYNGMTGPETVPLPCAANSAAMDNRSLMSPADSVGLPVVCFGQCDPCMGVGGCNSATSITCGQSVMGNTGTGAVEPGLMCTVDLNTSPGLWYKFTSPGGVVTFSTSNAGTTFNSKLGVFSGSCGSLVCMIGADDVNGDTLAQATVGTLAGTDYFVFVTGSGSASGNFQLTVTCGPPCPVDLVLTDLQSPLAGTYLAENTITVTSTVLVNLGSDVRLGAPDISLLPTTEAPLTATLETNATGCQN